jgi:RNA polymerase sigma factor (sigma-70 family)
MNQFDTSLGMLKRVQSGDDAAWTEFARRVAIIVTQWASWKRLQPADAEDLTHDTLLIVLAKIKDFKHCGRGSLRAWLRIIARRCFSRAQSSKKNIPHPELADRYRRTDDQITDLEAEFDRLQELDLLKSCMLSVKRRVRPQAWEAFHLLAVEGRSGQDAATQLNMQVDAVHAAKTRVQKLITGELRRRDNVRPPDSSAFA